MLTAALIGAGALKGVLDAKANQRQQKKNDEFRRTAIAYSPWTGMGDPGMQSAGNTDMFGGALGGGLQGAVASKIGSNAGIWGQVAGGGSPAVAQGIQGQGAQMAAEQIAQQKQNEELMAMMNPNMQRQNNSMGGIYSMMQQPPQMYS